MNQRRLTVPRRAFQECLIEPRPLAAAIHDELASGGVDGHHLPALTVRHAEPKLVALQDDPIAGREGTAGQLHVVGSAADILEASWVLWTSAIAVTWISRIE